MEWSKEVFASNLKRYMKRSNVTQQELADIVGVSQPTVNDWLSAKKYPRINKIDRMADYFGILKSDLIEDKKNPATTDGMSENRRKLMQMVDEIPEEALTEETVALLKQAMILLAKRLQ